MHAIPSFLHLAHPSSSFEQANFLEPMVMVRFLPLQAAWIGGVESPYGIHRKRGALEVPSCVVGF